MLPSRTEGDSNLSKNTGLVSKETRQKVGFCFTCITKKASVHYPAIPWLSPHGRSKYSSLLQPLPDPPPCCLRA